MEPFLGNASEGREVNMSDRLTSAVRENGIPSLICDDDYKDAIRKLADYEDREEVNKAQFVTKEQREFIDAIAECILESTTKNDIARYAHEFVGAWLMITTGWDSKQ